MKIAVLLLSIVGAGCAAAPSNVTVNSGKDEQAVPPVVMNYEAGTESLSLVTERRTTLPRSAN